jgi:hypothetical protein
MPGASRATTTHRNGPATSASQLSDFTRLRDGSRMASVSVEPSSTKPHFEVRPSSPFETTTAATQQPRLRNLSVPTDRQSKAVCSTPEGWRRLEGDTPGGSRPGCGRGDFGHAASATVRSSLGRRAASGGRWLNAGRMSRTGHRGGGQSKQGRVGPSPQGDVLRDQVPDAISDGAVARGAPVRRVAPRPGPVVAATHQGSFMSAVLRQGFWSWVSLSR